MKDRAFGKRLKKLRETAGLIQPEVAQKTGLGYSTVQNNEAGQRPNQNNLQKYIDLYGCTKIYLLEGIEPIYQNPDLPEDVSKEALYNKVEMRDMHTAAPGGEYNADMDDFGKAASGLKEIFDSGDPVLIPAIQANIHAFQISVRREVHIQEQTNEINDLKKRMESLERRLLEDDRRKGERRIHDLGPPGGIERRSGTDRRKMSAGG